MPHSPTCAMQRRFVHHVLSLRHPAFVHNEIAFVNFTKVLPLAAMSGKDVAYISYVRDPVGEEVDGAPLSQQ